MKEVETLKQDFWRNLWAIKRIKIILRTCLLFLSRPLFDDVTEFIERDLRLLFGEEEKIEKNNKIK